MDVVNALAVAGLVGQACYAAGSITDSYHRSRALSLLARRIGPTSTGRRMAAEAVRSGGWYAVLEALTTVAPESLTVLADEVQPRSSPGELP